MSVATTTLSIEQYFVDNWVYSQVDYLSPSFTPSSTNWIQLSIAPVLNTIESYTNCTLETFDIHIVSFASNKREAALQMDEVVTFIQAHTIDNVFIKAWRNNGAGVLEDGTYYYKFIFDSRSTQLEQY